MADALIINESNAKRYGIWMVVDRIDHDCDVRCDGNLNVLGDCIVLGNQDVGGNQDVRGKQYVRGYIVVRGMLVYSHLAPPRCSELIACGGIVPAAWQKDYWAERLNVSLEGCYERIIADLTPMLPKFLARTDLAPIERMILESHLPERKVAAKIRADELAKEREAEKVATSSIKEPSCQSG